jgi:hypothetical protein
MTSPRLYDEEMLEVVNKFLNLLEKKHPELKPDINRNREELAQQMVLILSSQKNLNKRTLSDNDFLKQLTLSFVTAISINKMEANPENNPLKKIEDILKSKGIDLNDPKLNPLDPRFDPKELEKKLDALNKLTPEDKKAIRTELKNFVTQLAKDLEKAGLILPKPTPGGKKPDIEEEMTKGFDPLINLLGIISSRQTGGLAVVVQCAMGNGLGFPDQNPYHGTAQIDRPNDINDNTLGGDYMGLNASAIGNMLEFAGDPFVAEFKEELHTSRLAISGPTPNHP